MKNGRSLLRQPVLLLIEAEIGTEFSQGLRTQFSRCRSAKRPQEPLRVLRRPKQVRRFDEASQFVR